MNIKKCPTCQQGFPEQTFFCPNDATDLTAVPIEPQESALQQGQKKEAGVGKVCARCAAVNKVYAVLCQCGYELTSGDVGSAPASTSLPPSTPSKRLVLRIGGSTVDCKDGDKLGRDGTVACDVMRAIPTVSTEHVGLEWREGAWWVRNLPLRPNKTQKNATILDGRDIQIGESAVLTANHVLRLSTKCEVYLSVI